MTEQYTPVKIIDMMVGGANERQAIMVAEDDSVFTVIDREDDGKVDLYLEGGAASGGPSTVDAVSFWNMITELSRRDDDTTEQLKGMLDDSEY